MFKSGDASRQLLRLLPGWHLDHLLSGLALGRLHETTHLGLGLGTDNLRDLDTLILSVGGAVLLMYSETEILRESSSSCDHQIPFK